MLSPRVPSEGKPLHCYQLTTDSAVPCVSSCHFPSYEMHAYASPQNSVMRKRAVVQRSDDRSAAHASECSTLGVTRFSRQGHIQRCSHKRNGEANSVPRQTKGVPDFSAALNINSCAVSLPPVDGETVTVEETTPSQSVSNENVGHACASVACHRLRAEAVPTANYRQNNHQTSETNSLPDHTNFKGTSFFCQLMLIVHRFITICAAGMALSLGIKMYLVDLKCWTLSSARFCLRILLCHLVNSCFCFARAAHLDRVQNQSGHVRSSSLWAGVWKIFRLFFRHRSHTRRAPEEYEEHTSYTSQKTQQATSVYTGMPVGRSRSEQVARRSRKTERCRRGSCGSMDSSTGFPDFRERQELLEPSITRASVALTRTCTQEPTRYSQTRCRSCLRSTTSSSLRHRFRLSALRRHAKFCCCCGRKRSATCSTCLSASPVSAPLIKGCRISGFPGRRLFDVSIRRILLRCSSSSELKNELFEDDEPWMARRKTTDEIFGWNTAAAIST